MQTILQGTRKKNNDTLCVIKKGTKELPLSLLRSWKVHVHYVQ